MNKKLKDLGFQTVKPESGRSNVYINVSDLGVISLSGKLRRELSIKRTENCCIYFNPDEGILGLHIGTFNSKKHPQLDITNIAQDYTISARDELTHIQDEYPGYTFIPQENLNNSFDDIEIEYIKDPPDPYSRMILIHIQKEKTAFRT